jgi:hypothetical protein
MNREIEAILGKAIYTGLRSRCKGYLTCNINNDICYIHIKFDDVEISKIILNIYDKILDGSFTSENVINGFIRDWEKYYMDIQRKRLFYRNIEELG